MKTEMKKNCITCKAVMVCGIYEKGEMDKTYVCKYWDMINNNNFQKKDDEIQKPPLGVMPEFFYERERILELIRAIRDYVGATKQGDHLEKWADELKERVLKYNKFESKL